jgi:SagB-type dehydrogenase family enzyme
MLKLVWVLLPIAAAVAWLAVRAWRGTLPSRQAINVLFSLLLLGYVAGTAGLGIFWVANQQLPVFDWHYLFGYATVLTLVVHLGFNLRVVWQHLRRMRGAAVPAAGAQAAGVPARRKPLLGLAGAGGLVLAAGLGYLVGLRHGRTELQLVAGPAADPGSAAAASPAADFVERFHAFSGHSRTRVLRHAASTDWGAGPPAFKRYAASQRLALPAPGWPVAAASRAGPDLAAVGTWLWHTAGISERRGGIAFRTSPSSGALFASEWYLLALDVPGLAAGLWHYDPESHALHRLPPPAIGQGSAEGANATNSLAATLTAMGPLALPQACHAVIVASAIFARSGHKYGDRTYRYVLADLGHALENLRVAARAHGNSDVRLLTHFDEQRIGAALGLEPHSEAVLAVAALAPVGTSAVVDDADHGLRWVSALHAGAAGDVERIGLTEAMQRATSLRVASASRAPGPGRVPWHGEGVPPPRPEPPGAVFALPAARGTQADPLRTIAGRRSRRRFSAQDLPVQALADVLQAMTQAAPVLSSAVRIDVLTAAVSGLEPAAWRHRAGGVGTPSAPATLHRSIVHGPALRGRARAAALDQDVIGDAAVVFVLSLDRDVLRADRFGPARGYRHGFIEAGLVGERIYLAAGGLGLAACAVGAFYDDEAAALVGVETSREWVVHFAALGLPA